MEDFLDHTYNTVSYNITYLEITWILIQWKQLLEAEFKRKLKKEPALATELVKDLFPLCVMDSPEVAKDPENVERDVISELWTFG